MLAKVLIQDFIKTPFLPLFFMRCPSKTVGKINALDVESYPLTVGLGNLRVSIKRILEKSYEKDVFVAIRSHIH